MTLYERFFYYIKLHPEGTYPEYAKALGSHRHIMSQYGRRLEARGYVINNKKGNLNRFEIIKDLNEEKEEKEELAEFKMDIYQDLLTTYLDDFKSAAGFADRVKIGKLIIRLLEKL